MTLLNTVLEFFVGGCSGFASGYLMSRPWQRLRYPAALVPAPRRRQLCPWGCGWETPLTPLATYVRRRDGANNIYYLAELCEACNQPMVWDSSDKYRCYIRVSQGEYSRDRAMDQEKNPLSRLDREPDPTPLGTPTPATPPVTFETSNVTTAGVDIISLKA